jgi:hypothetical protein
VQNITIGIFIPPLTPCANPCHYPAAAGGAKHSYVKEGTYTAKLIKGGISIKTITITVVGIAPAPSISMVSADKIYESIYIKGKDFRPSNTIHIGSMDIPAEGYNITNSDAQSNTEPLYFSFQKILSNCRAARLFL